ncbi:attractin [Anthonomus grandis grandis]|uniref:attractin n=1 Tax=Anthonomus grandis grandis TaxID=2921223 RepID=UPI002165BECF|nr:attractin [Anthonomus grandis grandis]
MLKALQMFLFLFKSKYRRKHTLYFVINLLIFVSIMVRNVMGKCVDNNQCMGNGLCKNETCICFEGWQGPHCQFCGGKVRLGANSGTIFDGPGNYSLTSKCSWLIDAPHQTITLHFEEFATECGWDHLYVFDGDSVNSPLLAVFSGLMYKNGYKVRRVPEITATSGSALVHFFSDDAYNMSGFNITYRLNACPSMVSSLNCSGNGECIDGICTCDGGWDGIACHLRKCPDDCGAHENRGVCEPERGCHCFGEYKGDDCSQLSSRGYWETINIQSYVPPGSASHSAVVWKDSMFVIAGERYDAYYRERNIPLMYIYDFNGNVWETPQIYKSPMMRYGHSTVIYGDKIFLYGGVVGNRGTTSELWAFDISAQIWENITVKADACNVSFLMCGPLKSAGHTATIVNNNTNKKNDKMVVIFGHSPQYGYLNTVQEYYFGTREWYIVNTTGYPVKGGYGHTATWDPLTQKIYVFGGVISESESSQHLSRNLYSYEPNERIWILLADAPSSRFLHSATFISGGLMLVFGGNTHNDTAHSFGAKCYSSELLTYDVICDSWNVMTVREDLHADLARFGHSAVTFEGSLYIYGGFDGQMLNDMLKFTPGDCQYFNSSNSCLSARPGVKCVWDDKMRCLPVMRVPKEVLREDSLLVKCPGKRSTIQQMIVANTEKCKKMEDCLSCVYTTSECVWCNGVCIRQKNCKNVNGGEQITNETGLVTYGRSDLCPADHKPICRQLHTCTACTYQPFCRWRFEHAKCVPFPYTNATVEADVPAQCQKVCSEFTSCLNCTQEECIWCQNEGRCVDKNAYTSSFPYGQCREWTTVGSKCRTKEGSDENTSQCSFYKTCPKCRDDPACGWCDDGSRTGLGTCMPGGYGGPTLDIHSLSHDVCSVERWHFTTCPSCQCNGHALCKGNSSMCQTCQNLTTGPHCEHCKVGYWGSAVNGGKCQKCECRGHADDCHRETGKCHCRTKGLIGDQCEKCDAANHYRPDIWNNGSCYYDLTIDYQFTFNLSKKEDRHFRQINFRNSPQKADIDVDFSVICSEMAKMNITMRRFSSPGEVPIFSSLNCTTFRHRFGKSDYPFGYENNMTLTTFYVYVYDFQPPLLIQISFSQYPKLNLQQFFITFSSCFLLLLLVAAVLWKIKQRYDMFRRRQRLFVEMEQMASRPFSQVLVELERQKSIDLSDMWKRDRKKRDSPSPIALEPCEGSRAAVLSLLVRLPTGGEDYTVKGQAAGLCIASALVTLGNPRRLSIDHMKTETKTGKARKGQSQHPDSCI